MARIVIGIGSSHSPHVSTEPEDWHLHAARDYANPNLDMPALARVARHDIASELTPLMIRDKHTRCQDAIARLAQAFAEAEPDVAVIVGDDQRELFLDECNPTFAVFTGDELLDVPPPLETVSPSHRVALWSRHKGVLETYPTRTAFASHIAGELSRDDFDIATASKQLAGRSLGHAFTFVRLRLMGERIVPVIPVFVNCYYPPNQPSPRRCYAFGRALRNAIESWDEPLRVAVVASGGLSHFVIDEAMDRRVLQGIVEKRADLLTSLPAAKLNGGNSEIRNWIAVAGAMEHATVESVEYVPAYRTPSGTGCGMSFVRWNASPVGDR